MSGTAPAEQDQTGQAPFGATVAVMAVVGLVLGSQAYVTIPLMPQIAEAWDVSQSSAAWATSAFAIAYACGSLLSGPLADRFGRRSAIWSTLAVMAVATVAVPLAGGQGTGLALRAVQGVAAGVFAPVVFAYFGERLPAQRLALALTTVSAALGGALVFGQLAAQFLEAQLGWSAVFWITAVVLALGAVAARKVMLPDAPRTTRGGFAFGNVLSSPRLVPLFVTALAVLGGVTAIYTGVQLYGPDSLGDPDAMFALRASALPSLLVAVLAAPKLAHVKPTTRACGALALAALGMVGAALSGDSVLVLGIALFVTMVGASTAGPALVQAVGGAAGADRATAIAVYSFLLNLGAGLGAQVPQSTDVFTHLALWIALAFVAAIGLVALAAKASARTAAAEQKAAPVLSQAR
ncbi:MFS transporter [Streptomyces sp. NPDC101118]|uniref:MFS transporter n=1 Tax=Streptomyces sp. NPDC101118 TaxID=3366109 RepID=UPI00380216E1